LERLAEAKGIKLKRHGENLIGLCPFHDDREPSLVITPSKNLWHCLGACQAGGTVIDWVMRAEGVRFRHAVELLREGLPSLDVSPLYRACWLRARRCSDSGGDVEGRKRAVNEGEVFGKSESSRRLIERNARRPSVEGRARRGGAGASRPRACG